MLEIVRFNSIPLHRAFEILKVLRKINENYIFSLDSIKSNVVRGSFGEDGTHKRVAK